MSDHPAAARAGVLGRLWGALAREPLPGVVGREIKRDILVVRLAHGAPITGPATAAQPYAETPPGLTVGGTEDPARLVEHLRPYADPSRLDRLAAELTNSVANLAAGRGAQPPPDGGPPALHRYDPTGLEQCVVDGHPLHPLCRTRMGMSPAEVRRYAPEHRPVVELVEVEVPADRWFCAGDPLPPRLLVHPWQVEHVLDAYPRMVVSGNRRPARPLMSLRTLDAGGRHLKTAVDVQMTSAVRTVSPAALRNGPPVSALLADLAAGEPGLAIMRERSAGSVLVDGQPCRSLAMVWRDAPSLAPGETVLPLSVLSAPSPASGRPILTEAVTAAGSGPDGFAADLAGLLVPPLLRLLHRGAALEAHGQNTLVVLRAGRPLRICYRDLGGLRLSPVRLAAAGMAVPPLAGDLPAEDPDVLRTKLLAALGTALGELAATLDREYGAAGALWKQVAAAARRTYSALPPTAAGDAAALFGAAWPVKATTAMRLAADPLVDLWTELPNPLGDHA